MLKTVNLLGGTQLRCIKRGVSSIVQTKALIDGTWVDAGNKATFDVINPATGDVLEKVPDLGLEETKRAVQAAKKSFYSKEWSDLTGKQRSELLMNWHRLLEKNRDEIACIMNAEAGKSLSEAQGEVTYGNSFVQWFAEEARRIYGEVIEAPVASRQLFAIRQPIGVAALITPWNFPHAMITRKAGAALAAGCTLVIKPAEDTPLTALAIAKLAEDAGFPKGVFNVITSSRKNAPIVGEHLCKSPDVAGISFTGSTAVGKTLYKNCAEGVKRLALELGGNAPFIVFNSANIDHAVEGAIVAKFRNGGQSCVGANRLFIQDKVYDEFLKKFSEKVCAIKVGSGKDCQLGPVINQMQLDKISSFVEDAKSKKASILVGGKTRPDLGKFFFEPTIITDIRPDMKLYSEEVFGPVASILRFEDEEEVLQKANAVEGGLAGYFYSQDLHQIFRVARKLEVGMIGVNEGLISTAEAPFGGVKQSGLGREGSRHGIDDFTHIKYICLGNLIR